MSHQPLFDTTSLSFFEPTFSPNLFGQVPTNQPVVYWMTREHRFHHNRALAFAQQIAQSKNAPLCIVVAFRRDLSQANMLDRTFDFVLTGLQEVEAEARKHQIPMYLLQGDPTATIAHFVQQHGASIVITDLFPLEPYRSWHDSLTKTMNCPLLVVDGHNTVPVWITSNKREYAARTIRPKIWKQFDTHRIKLPKMQRAKVTPSTMPDSIDWKRIRRETKTQTGFPVINKSAGATAAQAVLRSFVTERLESYADDRNDPNQNATSQLSAYVHFGHLSCDQVVSAIQSASAPSKHRDAFLEEFVVRKELSDNFCYYTQKYRSLEAVPEWAQATLSRHAKDDREYLYTYQQFLDANTHDPAWNAAQQQLRQTGYLHGYMRMYWAKKILEWTKTPEQALEIAIQLNDLLELDGRDPNGYVGILWAIGGLHDRPWQERPIFGTIRYMNANGLQRKFDLDAYIERWKLE